MNKTLATLATLATLGSDTFAIKTYRLDRWGSETLTGVESVRTLDPTPEGIKEALLGAPGRPAQWYEDVRVGQARNGAWEILDERELRVIVYRATSNAEAKASIRALCQFLSPYSRGVIEQTLEELEELEA